MGFFSINKKLIPLKGHYFLFNGATAPVVAFLSILARQLGFSATLVGIIYTVLPIVGMLAKPLMGGIADKFRCKKLLFILFQGFTTLALLGINFIPEVPTKSKVHFACDNGAAVLDTLPNNNPITDNCVQKVIDSLDENELKCKVSSCNMTSSAWETCKKWYAHEYWPASHPSTLNFIAYIPTNQIVLNDKYLFFRVKNISLDNKSVVFPYCGSGLESIKTVCDMHCESHSINNIITKFEQDDKISYTYQFWLFFLLAAIGWASMAVVVSTGDAICFEMLEDKPHFYGNQRLWGSVGWGLFSVVAGFMVDKFSYHEAKKDYSSSFYMMFVLMVLDIIVSTRLKYVQRNMSQSIIRDVGKLLARARIFVFMVWCMFVGMCTGIVWQFLFWMLEDVARSYDGCDMHNWIKTLEGIVMGIQCLGGELPFFFLSGYILNRLGHVNCMTLVLLFIGIRYVLYSLLTNPWWILPIELMNGITFGLFYATMASYASIVALPGTEATVQGIVGAVFEGVGVSLGSLVGGILFDKYGGIMMYRIFGIASLICCLAHFVVQYLLQRRRNGLQELNSSSSIRYAPPKDAVRLTDDDQQEMITVEH